MRARRSSTGKSRRLRRALGIGVMLLALGSAAPAAADEYDDQRAGHPLRVAAYVLHPVGVMLDWLIFRPAHWVGSHEPFRTVFGHTEED